MQRLYILFAAIALACTPPASADPFDALRSAYASRDAEAAAAAYSARANLIYRYEGAPEETYTGSEAIARSFKALFDRIDPGDRIDLNFRETGRSGNQVRGVYRLRLGKALTSYGRFDVTLDASGRFASDISSSATREDFEEAAGPVMFNAADESLDRPYYARLTGRYRLADGCVISVTRSVVRLFVRDSCSQQWRGLSRQSGRVWTAGDQIISSKASRSFRFAAFAGANSPWVDITEAGKTIRASRIAAYRSEDVSFTSADGTKLAGTLYLPSGGAARKAAAVMLHGSGPQDRDGYASIIALLADELAASGRIVLAYDKRGSGSSDGDGDRAGFAQLASDARAAMEFLARRQEVDPERIGLAGSSQAGWVAARAIADGARPADVLLLGAAGAALTVAEQNLYNSEMRMRCAGMAPDDIRLGLAQQSAFFAFLKDPARAAELDRLTAAARLRPALGDWLFPDSRSTDRSAGAWYVVLDPAFDPLPIWRRYRGRAMFLFSEHDDATPTALARARLKGFPVSVISLPGAQHLGLLATGICGGEIAGLDRFSPSLMRAIARFATSGP